MSHFGGLRTSSHAPDSDWTFQDPLEEFDYYELCVYDVNCTPRGRLVAKKRMQEIMRQGGLGTNAAICFFTPNGDALNHPWFGTKEKPGNVCMRPDLNTLAKVSKKRVGEHKVGQLICDLVFQEQQEKLEPTSPRSVALRQLEKLRKEGLEIHYCFEMEFTLLKSDGSPLDAGTSWGNMVDLMKTEETMLDFMEILKEAKVHCGTLHPEAGPSQYEFVLTMSQGIQGADMAARFRKEAQSFFEREGFLAKFSSHIEFDGLGEFFRTMHLNHFLSKCKSNESEFNDGPKGVSVTAWRWMAGIKRHLPALMALFWPTENCYKRYTDDFINRLEFYSKHQRNTCIRRKTEGGQVFLENRLPSNFSNPYLVLAGTIAAGLDGVKNYPWRAHLNSDKLPLPDLPVNLQKALEELGKDEDLTNELDVNFVEVFIEMKKQEIRPLDLDLDLEY